MVPVALNWITTSIVFVNVLAMGEENPLDNPECQFDFFYSKSDAHNNCMSIFEYINVNSPHKIINFSSNGSP